MWLAVRRLLKSAPGPSGLRNEHLILAFGSGCTDQLLSLRKHCGLNGARMAPRRAADHYFEEEGRRTPYSLQRTIATRSSSALLHSFERSDIKRQFVNRSDGGLAVAEFTRASITCGASPSILQVDVKNASNSFDLDVFLLDTAYACRAPLLLGV